MEEYVNEVVKRLMYSLNIDIYDLNKVVELHKTVNNIQAKRLEMALRDKLKQINVYLDDNFLDRLENMIFYRKGKSDLVDLRLINKNDIAIIKEDSIELSDRLIDVNELEAGLSLRGEAYSYTYMKTGGEPVDFDPKIVFKDFYTKMKNRIKLLSDELNIQNAKMYFDRNLDSFYFDYPQVFNVVVTEEPNIIEIYEVDTTQDKWIFEKINGDHIRNLMGSIDFSLLKVNIIVQDAKKTMKNRINKNDLSDFDIEMILDEFRNRSFSIDNLIETYYNLFENGNCMLKENESAITRLKFIAAEKIVEDGFTYEKSVDYIDRIFENIKLYKNEIIGAIKGENKFPEYSLVNTLEKISTVNSTQIEGKALVKKLK